MAMTRQRWSVNALSTELGVDRRTIARQLDRVEPAGQGPSGPLYWLRDAVRALGMGSITSDRAEGVACRMAVILAERLQELGERLARCSDPRECHRLVLHALTTETLTTALAHEPGAEDLCASKLRADLGVKKLTEILEALDDGEPASEIAGEVLVSPAAKRSARAGTARKKRPERDGTEAAL